MGLKKHSCPKCRKIKSYSNMYDSYYCESCNEWLENSCTDSNCKFCKQRPEKPNEKSSQEPG